MGIIGKLEVEVDIKSSGDLFHELVSSKPHHVSGISPTNIQNCELHEGEFHKSGSVIFWNYTLDGEAHVAKQIKETIEENKKVRYKFIEGDLLKVYKNLSITMELIPKGDITGVKWIIEFEKHVDDGPYPTNVMNLCISVTKDIEAHHIKA